MDIDKTSNNHLARQSRDARPIRAFMDLYNATDSALLEISSLDASAQTKEVLLRSHVISTVTAVEVYYRDMLDSIFKMCSPGSFKGALRKLHDRSYKIDDLIDIYVHRIHPLQLVTDNLSFQNVNSIENVYKVVIGKPFFKETKQLKWRIPGQPDSERKITHTDIDNLKDIFELRHQLIHNPNTKLEISLETVNWKINSILGVIMASDLVLTGHINSNIDPELKTNDD